jgi:hypothetical protein
MKLESPWFDRIRTKAKAQRGPAGEAAKKCCEYPGCTAKGEFRAPKGRDREGEYWHYCFEHVRAYNQGYNFFRDMPEDDVLAYQKDSLTGHRPTWTMGANTATGRAARGKGGPRRDPGTFEFDDSHGLFGDRNARPKPEKPKRQVRNLERKAFEELGLDLDTPPEEVKSRFKTLVKRLHPDANGGDRGTEDKLRAVIQAYNHLKQAGFC